MNKMIKKIACAAMAFTLITGIFTGCKANVAPSTNSSTDIKISDFGMQDSTLVIVVEEYKAFEEKYTGLECPCAVLELNHMPEELLIVSTTGEQFNAVSF